MPGPTRQRERTTEDETETGEETGCPECESDSLVRSGDGGELVCEDCGLVIEEEHIDRGPEWRSEWLNARHSGPRSMFSSSMTSPQSSQTSSPPSPLLTSESDSHSGQPVCSSVAVSSSLLRSR